MTGDTQKIIYCDHSATTPVAAEVAEEMQRVMRDIWGNPSSVHQTGRAAKVELELARERLAESLGARRNEVIFTGGGTESDNFALRGIAAALREHGNRIITSRVEHHAILHTCEALEHDGYAVTYLDVDQYGRVNPADVESAITEDTILISIMHANNEIGTINPIDEIGRIAHHHRILFHTDAVQTFGKLPVDVETLPVDALSISGHKIYGPKGIGVLYANRNIDIHPQLTGGSQERNLRAGTENLPAIVGMARAVQLMLQHRDEETGRLRALQQQLEEALPGALPDAKIHGHPRHRIPGLTHMGIPGVDGESLVLNLDMRGIHVSSGSACSSGSITPSHVLLALGYDRQTAREAIRISLGKSNTADDIPVIVRALADESDRIRKAGARKHSAMTPV